MKEDATQLKKKFMAMSVENPFRDGKQYDYFKDMTGKRVVKMEKRRYEDMGSRRHSDFDLPDIKINSGPIPTKVEENSPRHIYERKLEIYKRDHEMVNILQPFKKLHPAIKSPQP